MEEEGWGRRDGGWRGKERRGKEEGVTSLAGGDGIWVHDLGIQGGHEVE